MSKILVVDDSPVDLLFARKVVEDGEGYEVICAKDGREALDLFRSVVPAIVVTDMVMPRVDGLQLVRELRARYPFVPVVIMTSKGSEEMAVRALQEGAASYVPKHNLVMTLRDTLESVLAVTGQQRGRAELLNGTVEQSFTFDIGNDGTLVRPLVQFVQETVGAFEICDEPERMRVGIAIEEALNNAAEHGNLELESSLRDADMGAYFREVRARCQELPYRDRHIRTVCHFSRGEAVVQISDEGSGFDPSTLPDPHDPANLEATSGRGVTLMRMFMDEVRFNDVGNEVTMIKRRAPCDSQTAATGS